MYSQLSSSYVCPTKLVTDLDAFCQICASGSETAFGPSLLGGLGVVSVDWVSFSVYKSRAPTELDDSTIAYLRVRLLQVLIEAHRSPERRVAVEDKLTLLASMEKHVCWRACLLTREGSYALAQFLIDAVVFYTVFLQASILVKSSTRVALTDISDDAMPRVLRILNEWIAPAAPWLGIPRSEQVGAGLFGVAWWSFNVPTTYESNGLLKATSPPFVPGLVPWSDGQIQCDLPLALETAD